ncbi:uncharacterized protein Z518_06871 [Rhinocladiella mackenziei CBS 650.93]|uniref:Uncharacterized protein n=1 Tax=Rhinocladiella mackenziei CBS 650.93 TaxID=1442369 RepID=A0A0D2IBX8_9EURO|nr:uncharacterized protein Z518_06871 [Rhinocladiella mackenziei CBS 650.93]KIX03319.1 hypothetical protein Z518_06871 [Rhinocladiella mackenziei CBS 650.93]
MPMPSLTKKYYHAPYPSIDPRRPELSAVGKVVLITGGGSGVGQGTAVAFAKAQAKVVVILGRRLQTLEETKSKVERLSKSTMVATYSLDISDEKSVADCFNDVRTKYGPIDICLNAAAYLSDQGTVKDSPVSEYWASFEIGVKGSYIVAQQFLRHCSDHDAVLIGVNSLIAHIPAVHVDSAPASYASSKIAAAKLYEYVAVENPHVRCYSLQPGIIETDMSRKSIEMMPEESQKNNRFLPFDDVSLPGCFSVWLSSREGAVIPSGRFLWSNWDVEELKERAIKLKEDPCVLTLTLPGWPFSLPEDEVYPDYGAAAKIGREP